MGELRRATLPVFPIAADKGWTKEELAYRTGLSMAMLDSLRLGRRNPGYRSIAAFKRALPDYTVEELIGEFVVAA